MFFISSSVPCSLLCRCFSIFCSASAPSVCVFMLHVPVCIVAVSFCYPCRCLLSFFCLLCVICRFSCWSRRVFASQIVTTWCGGCVLCCVVSVGLCWCFGCVFVCMSLLVVCERSQMCWCTTHTLNTHHTHLTHHTPHGPTWWRGLCDVLYCAALWPTTDTQHHNTSPPQQAHHNTA